VLLTEWVAADELTDVEDDVTDEVEKGEQTAGADADADADVLRLTRGMKTGVSEIDDC
jgi:hypothetical protein